MNILLYCDHTIHQTTRSGIQRVVINLAKGLLSQRDVHIDFVKWDEISGQLAFATRTDIKKLFPELHHCFDLNPRAGVVDYRFGDLLTEKEDVWMIYPEISYHREHGTNIYERIHTHCREYGIRVASILYDLIPVLEQEYSMYAGPHNEYVAELVRSDAILSISHFARAQFLEYIASLEVLTEIEFRSLSEKTIGVPLGEVNSKDVDLVPSDAEKNSILMLGTVEPRKQQVEFLRAFNAAISTHPALAEVEVNVFGSLHPHSADAFWSEVNSNPKINYHSYAPDEVIQQAFETARFSVFPSRSEGYGLPIVESLNQGVPCITANFGSMVEVAEGGGCLTVDVNSEDELMEAVLNLWNDDGLWQRLVGEIQCRERRDWGDYSADVLSAIDLVENKYQMEAQSTRKQLIEALEIRSTRGLVLKPGTILGDAIPEVRIEFVSNETKPEDLSGMLERADFLLPTDDQVCEHLPDLLSEARSTHPTPTVLPVDPSRAESAIIHTVNLRRRATKAKKLDELRSKIQRRLNLYTDSGLSIVISTFNRGPFVSKNVEWLMSLIRPLEGRVDLTVVDNTSTDNTAELLHQFVGEPGFTYICNPANMGMLGNLHVCSTLQLRKYVWIVGDDDFITPGAIERTLSAIVENNGTPLLIHNFQVYHRQSISDADSPQMFESEAVQLAPSPTSSGVYPVNEISSEHDNLFTAIYPIVFRQDVLAACFNYPFTGTPFIDLVECVPTTKLILETYRYHEAYWFAEPGITGNAHNSWSRHRPRWHLVLMPEVLKLAAEAGVNREKVWEWTKVHLPLFEEACQIAIDGDVSVNLSASEIEAARCIFRESVELPKQLSMVSAN